jgi:hypothetical protein
MEKKNKHGVYKNKNSSYTLKKVGFVIIYESGNNIKF